MSAKYFQIDQLKSLTEQKIFSNYVKENILHLKNWKSIFIQSEWVVQNWIYGDPLKDYCIIFVVLDPIKAKDWALKN